MHPPDDNLDPEELAARYVLALEDGDVLDVDELARRLPDESSRDEFRQLIEDAGAIQGLLPVQVRPGVVLSGRYKVIREVGSGGMGKVFEAEDEVHQRRVAVKVLAVFADESSESVQQFRHEAQLLAALQHPNIAAIHEVGSDGDVSYMVMDLAQGKALHSVIERAVDLLRGKKPRAAGLLAQAVDLPLPSGAELPALESSWFREAARIALTVARTIENAHAHGLLHRDIKPQNILLRADHAPVLLDFGLAALRESEHGQVHRGLSGSAVYLAPEQAMTGLVGIDPRIDVYQLGAVLYELITLRQAFSKLGVTDLLRCIAQGDFARPRTVDRRIPFELEAICLRALETHPRDRYQTAGDFANDLDCFLEGKSLPVAAQNGRFGGMLNKLRFAARRRATLLLVAALALSVSLFVGPFGGEPAGSWGMIFSASSTPEWPRMDREHPMGRASFEEAKLAFVAAAEPELADGRSPDLTDRQRSGLAVEFSMADMLVEDAWPRRDPRLHSVSFAVQQP